MAHDTLPCHVPVPRRRSIASAGEDVNHVRAAPRNAETLRRVFAAHGRLDIGWPRFDLVILGMGADGEGSRQPDVYPSQSISTRGGALDWLVDRPAAARLATSLGADRSSPRPVAKDSGERLVQVPPPKWLGEKEVDSAARRIGGVDRIAPSGD
jgi:hypothetical protein